MSENNVLIIGEGHLAGRTKKLATDKGANVTYLPGFANSRQDADLTTLRQTELLLSGYDMRSFSTTFVLFDKDDQNLEWVIALMALYPYLNITTALFNENLRPHLENAHPTLKIINPAKIAAPFFVEALDKPAGINRVTHPEKQKSHSPKSPADRLIWYLLLIFGGIAMSAATYFHYAENLSWLDSIYFVVVTIATVGYGDIHLRDAGALSKIIGIVLILCSAIFIWLIFSLLIDRLIKQRAQRMLGRKKYAYSDHIILCGLGRLGYFIAETLLQRGEKIVIIETDEESANTRYYRSIHVDVFNGNARHPQVLQDAGVGRCRALISAISDDSVNLEIGLNARHFQPDILLVLRIFDESMADVIREKFNIHLTKSMSFICAEKLASLLQTD